MRLHTRGSRVEESEGYREELRRLPVGHHWPQYEVWLRELGFEIVDAAHGPRDRLRFALVKEGLHFTLEISCDYAERVAAIDPGPNL